MANKTCIKCGETKDIAMFCHDKTRGDGLHPWCKDCKKEYSKKYYEEHHAECLEKKMVYRSTRRNHLAELQREWYQNNKKHINERNKNRRIEDKNYKIRCVLRTRVWNALKYGIKAGSAVRDLGCSIEFLVNYLESMFKPGMSWKNYGKEGWHIDHIKPLASFDLTKREQFINACRYTNLQPLWAHENYSKGART